MDSIDIVVKAQEIPRALENLSPIDKLVTFVTLTSNKNMKAQLVQDYIQKHGPIPNKYADKIKEAMEV